MTEDEPQPVAAGPVSGRERFAAVDTLRGVAVLGILVMNIYAFAMPIQAYGNPLLMGGTEWYNLGTWFVTHVFFDQKFMTIFSMLFGGGMVIMWQRAEARSAPFGRIFYRRQLWLLVIGALHGYLVWFGDILVPYAVMGMLVFFFRRAGARRLVTIGVCLLMITPIMSILAAEGIDELRRQVAEVNSRLEVGVTVSEEELAAADEWAEMEVFVAPNAAALAGNVAAYRGSYADTLDARIPETIQTQTGGLIFYGARIAGLMLIGMGLVKSGTLVGIKDERHYKRMLLWGYGLGLPIGLLSSWSLWKAHWDGVFMFGVGMIPNYVGSVLVALGHVAAVMLLVKKGYAAALMARFSAVGRMALTNYLLHSIVMTTIFYGYGLGLYGYIPRAAQMLFVLGMICFQLWLSPLWLERFRFGPAEWL